MTTTPHNADLLQPPTAVPVSSLTNRIVSGAVFIVTFGVLFVGAWLRPDARGMGTHEELGLPPCGFVVATGLPCATCGYTTSFSLAAHGSLVQSFINQPAACVLALFTACMAVVSGVAFVYGGSLGPLGRALWRPRVVLGYGAFVLIAWVYKILIVIR
ncbi:MAG: DUF2752 domain-containing protein [Phycisphaera sp.]|nr:DUF2752 domain-containing protein [Phycisphaera sp.]